MHALPHKKVTIRTSSPHVTMRTLDAPMPIYYFLIRQKLILHSRPRPRQQKNGFEHFFELIVEVT